MSAFGVLFDMDGVIVDTNPTHNEALHQLFARHGLSYSQEELNRKAHGRPNAEWIPDLMKVETAAEIQVIADEKEDLFRQLYKDRMKALDGLIPLLEFLQKYEIKTAVATSAPKENADFILDGLEIRPFFEAILHSGHVTKGKPDPQIYLKAAAALSLEAADCVVIEDSLVGVKAGLGAGAKVVGITTTHTKEELSNCHLVIDDFWSLGINELIGLLGVKE